MQQGGFTPWEALRGGTIDGAKHFGMDSDIGSIEVGKLADMVVILSFKAQSFRMSYVRHSSILNR